MTQENALTIKSILDTLENAKISVQKEIDNIEETYKKLCEEAKASLISQLETLNSQSEYWANAVNGLHFVAPEKKTRKPRAKKNTEEANTSNTVDNGTDMVVDNIYEENNAVEEVPENGAPMPVAEDEKTPVDNEESPIFAEEVATFADTDTTEETTPVVEESPATEEWPVEEAAAEETVSSDNDGWPEFPESWK